MRCNAGFVGQFIGGALVLLSGIAFANEPSSYMQEDAFIEFMGSWETADGEWIPPDEISKLKLPKQKAEHKQEKKQEQAEDSEAKTKK